MTTRLKDLNEFYSYFHQNAEDILDQWLYTAQDGKSWICPVCYKGEHGDGIKLDQNREGMLHCFSGRHDGHNSGDFDGDILNLIGETYDLRTNREIIEKACDLFDLEIEQKPISREEERARDIEAMNRLIEDNLGWDDLITVDDPPKEQGIKADRIEDTTSQAQDAPMTRVDSKKEDVNRDRSKNIDQDIIDALNFKNKRYEAFINQSRKNLTTDRAINYLISRGISLETAQTYGIGYMDFAEIDGLKFIDSLIFPSSYDSFATRMLDPKGGLKSLKPKGARDIPFGLTKLLNPAEKNKRYDERYKLLEPIFIVEGLLDAPSIYEAGGDAIALNGTGTIQPIITAFKEFDIKRPILLAMDNDEAGRKAQETNYKKLIEAGLTAYKCDLIPQELDIKDANELLMADRDQLIKYVSNARKIPLANFEKGLNKNRERDFINGINESVNAPAISTGYNVLDGRDFLDGGLHEGLYAIGAISSLGKTAFTLQLADQVASAGHDVLYISLEMSANELIARSISRYTAKDLIDAHLDLRFKARTIRDITDGKRWENYTDPEKNYIYGAMADYFRDTGETMRIYEGLGDIDVAHIRRLVKEYVEFKGKAPVVFIDYLQLLQPPKAENGQYISMTDKQITDRNIFDLKRISRDFKTPVFVISSFNRESYQKEVTMASFKESGAIEYASDVLISLSTPRQGDPKARKQEEQDELDTGIRNVELKILKNRSGQRGGTILYNYHFRHNYYEEIGDKKRYGTDAIRSRSNIKF